MICRKKGGQKASTRTTGYCCQRGGGSLFCGSERQGALVSEIHPRQKKDKHKTKRNHVPCVKSSYSHVTIKNKNGVMFSCFSQQMYGNQTVFTIMADTQPIVQIIIILGVNQVFDHLLKLHISILWRINQGVLGPHWKEENHLTTIFKRTPITPNFSPH